jgi:hypothetical protein
MDSMRSLNTSLPKAKARKAAPQPDIHQAFRTAALSVTNLYKSAIADLEKARNEGQQEILEELLAFLDRQRSDGGEIARIRQWALERLDGQAAGNSDSEEEMAEDQDQQQRRVRSSSPSLEHSDSHSSTDAMQTPTAGAPPSYPAPLAEDPVRPDSAPLPSTQPTQDVIIPDDNTAVTESQPQPPSNSVFHFSSPQPLPTFDSTHDMQPRRNLAHSRRPTSRASRNLQRTAAANLFSLGNGAGQKRKLMDFFNVDLYDRNGPGGGGKRGRPC